MKSSLSLEEILAAVPDETGALLSRIAQVAAARKTAIHLVGGPVRDLLLERELVDVDLVPAVGVVHAQTTAALGRAARAGQEDPRQT